MISSFYSLGELSAQASFPEISSIKVEGNKRISTEAILRRFVYRTGGPFDTDLSAVALKKLDSLGQFSRIKIEKEADGEKVALFIVVEEKKVLDGYSISGNTAIARQKIVDHTGLRRKEFIDEHDVRLIQAKIKQLYREANFHNTQVSINLTSRESSREALFAQIEIDEGVKSLVREIHFAGVEKVAEWKLREALNTRELWLLGFADGSGRYNREMIEFDRRRIEGVYYDHGYVRARVMDVDVEPVKGEEHYFSVTFTVSEGERYKLRNIITPYDNEIDAAEFYHALTVKPGDYFSQSEIRRSTERVRGLLGKRGYINADVYLPPQIDEAARAVDLSFAIEKGSKVYVNRIDITGNVKTIDTVIRRELAFEEGSLLTTQALDDSKRRIESLGYFDRDGVIWKFKKVSDGLTDIELSVKEIKTGHFHLKAGIGGSQGRIGSGAQFGLDFGKRNLFGRGWDADLNLMAEGRRVGYFGANFSNPYVLDSNVAMGTTLSYRSDEYDQWSATVTKPVEKIKGGSVRLGFKFPMFSRDVQWVTEWGIESNSFKNIDRIQAEYDQILISAESGSESDQLAALRYQHVIDRYLRTSAHTWFGLVLTKDTRNHYLYPSRGHQLSLRSRLAFPQFNHDFSFLKCELNGSWFTPLIGNNDLVLAVHGRAGMVDSFKRGVLIPYRELFHMGGHDTVRGFVGGGAGPILVPDGELNERGNTPLGARRSLQLNVELQFPFLHESYGARGRVFYDAGGGWDTPIEEVPEKVRPYVKRNSFNMRHSIGFGFSMVRPQPIRVDWGYKIDRDKRFNESDWEMHLGMNMPW